MTKKLSIYFVGIITCLILVNLITSDEIEKPVVENFNEPFHTSVIRGRTVARYDFSDYEQLKDWVIEGPGKVQIRDNRLVVNTSNPIGDTVCWLKQDLPKEFLFEWEFIPDSTQRLAIIFFCAKGKRGEDILTGGLASRNGIFQQYINGDFNWYHISYWCPWRRTVHLRKNSGFYLPMRARHPGPEPHTEWIGNVHKYALLFRDNVLVLVKNGKIVLRYNDNQGNFGLPFNTGGKIGLQLMRPTKAMYDNIQLSEIK